MDFGQALRAMRAGMKVKRPTREGIFFIHGAPFGLTHFKRTDGELVMEFQPCDILASDWQIVGDPLRDIGTAEDAFGSSPDTDDTPDTDEAPELREAVEGRPVQGFDLGGKPVTRRTIYAVLDPGADPIPLFDEEYKPTCDERMDKIEERLGALERWVKCLDENDAEDGKRIDALEKAMADTQERLDLFRAAAEAGLSLADRAIRAQEKRIETLERIVERVPGHPNVVLCLGPQD